MDQLTAIRVFTRVAERGSFAQAAEELDISRAAASAHVAALEKHLGARLLNRTTRKVSLTAEGSDYLQRTRRILEELADAEETMRGNALEAARDGCAWTCRCRSDATCCCQRCPSS